MKPRVICVLGATATGKSGLSVALANRFGGEIVSADSMQIYKGFDVGTAKIEHEQMQGIAHHMIDVVDAADSFSVAQYCDMARGCINGIAQRGRIPFVVGGTGLYIDSLLGGVDFAQMEADEAYRCRLAAHAEQFGNESVWQMLCEIDKDLANTLHPNNVRRVIRALEVYHVSGKTMSEVARLSKGESPYECVYIGLRYSDRDLHYARINARVDEMIEQGLETEIRSLLDAGLPRDCQALQAIGYKEFLPYFDGETSMEEAVEAVKRNSRRYAKRQYTWFKRNENIHWIDVDLEDSLDRAISILEL